MFRSLISNNEIKERRIYKKRDMETCMTAFLCILRCFSIFKNTLHMKKRSHLISVRLDSGRL